MATVLALAYVCVESHGNLAIGALRLAGLANIASALRHNSRDPTRPLVIVGIPCDESGLTTLAGTLARGPGPER